MRSPLDQGSQPVGAEMLEADDQLVVNVPRGRGQLRQTDAQPWLTTPRLPTSLDLAKEHGLTMTATNALGVASPVPQARAGRLYELSPDAGLTYLAACDFDPSPPGYDAMLAMAGGRRSPAHGAAIKDATMAH